LFSCFTVIAYIKIDTCIVVSSKLQEVCLVKIEGEVIGSKQVVWVGEDIINGILKVVTTRMLSNSSIIGEKSRPALRIDYLL
jgi:activator of 2-hydroxyglutaryl-CoA dehydratase